MLAGVLYCAALAVGLLGLLKMIKHGSLAWAGGGGVLCTLLILMAMRLGEETAGNETTSDNSPAPMSYLPRLLEPEHGYVGSQSCRSCHPNEHASWDASYHQSMTQPATAESVLAPFDGVTLLWEGWAYHLERQGDEFWIDMVDPDWEREQIILRTLDPHNQVNPPRVRKRIVMTTGSHFKQTYWVASSVGKMLCRVPWSYRLDDQRWIPLDNDFLRPPGASRIFSVWDNDCIECHSVAGQPRKNKQTIWDAHVAELGIACEACHGAGAEHVRIRREQQKAKTLSQIEHDPIVNPRRCSSKQSTQICGQCHSYAYIKDYEQFDFTGHSYRPGDDLHESRHFLYYTETPQKPWLKRVLAEDPNLLTSRFWRDGAVRVVGREYNGLLQSKCYLNGELSCLSCHSMHDYIEPNHQLGQGMDGNQACLQCHQSLANRIEAHTHHSGDSSGSLCFNCHMPRTSYGLFQASLSHRIDSPSVAVSVKTGRPNACNLCHLDKTKSWSARYLSLWYGQPNVELDEEDRRVAASLLWLLRGDAAQRAVVAWHLGWEPAKKISGEDWLAPFLAQLLEDPYSAVRNVAGRALKKLTHYEGFEYDFIASEQELADSVLRAVDIWNNRPVAGRQTGSSILITPEGTLQQNLVDELLRLRDDRHIYLAE